MRPLLVTDDEIFVIEIFVIGLTLTVMKMSRPSASGMRSWPLESSCCWLVLFNTLSYLSIVTVKYVLELCVWGFVRLS